MAAHPLPRFQLRTSGVLISTWALISAGQIYSTFGSRLKMGDDAVCDYNDGGSTLWRFNIGAFIGARIADLKFIVWLLYKIVKKLVGSLALLLESFT